MVIAFTLRINGVKETRSGKIEMAAQGGTRDGAAGSVIMRRFCEGEHSYLDVNPIKLIKAHPRAPLRQPPEELPHHLVVDLIRAVEHHAQDADSLRLKMNAV